MDKKTKITYKSDLGEILFDVSSPFWVSEIKGASGLPVDVAVSARPLHLCKSVLEARAGLRRKLHKAGRHIEQGAHERIQDRRARRTDRTDCRADRAE